MSFSYTCCADCFGTVKALFQRTWPSHTIRVNGTMVIVEGGVPLDENAAWATVSASLPHGTTTRNVDDGYGETFVCYNCPRLWG